MSAYPICNVGSHSNGWKSASPWAWAGCLPYPISSTPGFSWSGFIWYPSNCYTAHKVIYIHQLSKCDNISGSGFSQFPYVQCFGITWFLSLVIQLLNQTKILRIILNALLYISGAWPYTLRVMHFYTYI